MNDENYFKSFTNKNVLRIKIDLLIIKIVWMFKNKNDLYYINIKNITNILIYWL